jgi:hypothetical protein
MWLDHKPKGLLQVLARSHWNIPPNLILTLSLPVAVGVEE